jgi:hypothetical protein
LPSTRGKKEKKQGEIPESETKAAGGGQRLLVAACLLVATGYDTKRTQIAGDNQVDLA